MSDVTDRIDEALDGTTRGPWEWDQHDTLMGRAGDPDYYQYPIEVLDVDHDGGCGCRRGCVMEITLNPADRALIAAAPSLLAEARDEITRLREGIARHRQQVGHLGSDANPALWALIEGDDQ